MKKTLATLATGLVLASVAGCSAAALSPSAAAPPAGGAAAAPENAAAFLARHALTGKSAEQVVEALDQDPSPRPRQLTGSVRADQVVLADGAGSAVLPLTTDKFYLSIAPFETRTHECYFHNLGTCQGELIRQNVHVTIADDSGKTLVDRDATTYANGFVAFWVPKGSAGTVTITKDGKTGRVPFATAADSATCLTTLKLV